MRVANWKGDLAALAIMLAATLASFWVVLQNGFVNWDDPVYLFRNPALHLSLVPFLAHAFTSFPLGNFHPLTSLGQWLLAALFGTEPLVFHLASLLSHCGNLCLLYLLLRRLELSVVAAGAGALLFAVQPLRVEAVAWASAQKDLWSTGLVLATLHTYLSSVRSSEKHRRWRRYALTLLFSILALLCKGTAMVLPLLLLLIDHAEHRGLPRRRLWVEKVPFWVLGLAGGIVALVARSRFQPVLEEGASVVELFWQGLYRFGAYLGRSLLPLRHSLPVYPPGPGAGEAWKVVSLLVFAAFVGMVVWSWRRRPVVASGLAFFAICLFPALPLQNLGYAGDRFTYLAAAGLSLAVAGALVRLERCRAGVRPLILVASLLLTIVWGAQSRAMSRAWHDSDRLISEYVALYKQSPGRGLYLALALENRAEGRRLAGLEGASRTDFAAANRAWPEWSLGLLANGETLLRQGRLAEAVAVFSRASRLDPENARVFAGRSIALRRMGRLREALADADRAIRLAPDDAVGYNSRGSIYQQLGRLPEALQDFSAAIRLAGDAAAPYVNRGLVYAELGERRRALADMQAALEIDPQNSMARDWLGQHGGRFPEKR